MNSNNPPKLFTDIVNALPGYKMQGWTVTKVVSWSWSEDCLLDRSITFEATTASGKLHIFHRDAAYSGLDKLAADLGLS